MRPCASWTVATPKSANASTTPRSTRCTLRTTTDIRSPPIDLRALSARTAQAANQKSDAGIRKRYRSTIAAMQREPPASAYIRRSCAARQRQRRRAGGAHLATRRNAGRCRRGALLRLAAACCGSNTGVALTPAGEMCARRIERSMSQLRDALAEADARRLRANVSPMRQADALDAAASARRGGRARQFQSRRPRAAHVAAEHASRRARARAADRRAAVREDELRHHAHARGRRSWRAARASPSPKSSRRAPRFMH